MKYIFIENFRGFKSTLLRIKDVNFFVGENSTGKSSLLKLVGVLNSIEFWLGGRFITPNLADYANYEDIVNIHSKYKGSFSIGIFINNSKHTETQKYEAHLMTFVEADGVPKLANYTFVVRGVGVETIIKGASVFYNKVSIKRINVNDENVKRLFIDWLDSHKKEKENFEKLDIEIGLEGPRMISDIVLGSMSAKTTDHSIFSVPRLFSNLTLFAPIRTKPDKIYFKGDMTYSSEGTHTPYVIRELLADKAIAKKFETFMRIFGGSSGLFDSVKVKTHGRKKYGPFELDVILFGKSTNITNVGYGVSQILPIVVEIYTARKGTTFGIQQPEIHLHPRAQAYFGDLVFNLAVLQQKQFMIETHSEYIIDRFRLNYRAKDNVQPDAQIVFFEKNRNGNKISTIDILTNGELDSKQPAKYREFFILEEMKLLGL